MQMQWTPESKLAYLVRLPWTVITERDADQGYLVLRVTELPSVIATGDSNEELEKDFWEALQSTLECALEFNDPIELPLGLKAPWEQPMSTPTPIRTVKFEGSGQIFSPPSGGLSTGMPARVNRAFNPVAV